VPDNRDIVKGGRVKSGAVLTRAVETTIQSLCHVASLVTIVPSW